MSLLLSHFLTLEHSQLTPSLISLNGTWKIGNKDKLHYSRVEFINTLKPLLIQYNTHWRNVDRKSIWKFSVLCTSNEKSIFFPWNFVRQYSNLQNDILDLHVALAKKILHMFEKSMKTPPKLGFSLISRGYRMKNYF